MSASPQVDSSALATDFEALGAAALRVAANLRAGLADLGGPGPDRVVGTHGDTASEALLDTRELAGLLGIGVRTLRRWRHEGRAPKPLRGEGPLRWRRADVERWIQERQS